MKSQGIEPDITTYNTLLVLAHRINDYEFGLDIFKQILKTKLNPQSGIVL